MNTSDIIKKIKILEGDTENAHANIRALRKLAMSDCPLNIGDRVKVNGYSHKGKQLEITSIWFTEKSKSFGPYWSAGISADGPGWVARGRVIKKDGKPGAQEAYHFEPLAVNINGR